MQSFISKNIRNEKKMISSSKKSGESKNSNKNKVINNNMIPNIQTSTKEEIEYNNKNKSDIPIKQNYSEDIEIYDNFKEKERQINYTTKNKPVVTTEIEYEKILDNQVSINENDNFNVYFMKPVFKSKTLTTSKRNLLILHLIQIIMKI